MLYTVHKFYKARCFTHFTCNLTNNIKRNTDLERVTLKLAGDSAVAPDSVE